MGVYQVKSLILLNFFELGGCVWEGLAILCQMSGIVWRSCSGLLLLDELFQNWWQNLPKCLLDELQVGPYRMFPLMPMLGRVWLFVSHCWQRWHQTHLLLRTGAASVTITPVDCTGRVHSLAFRVARFFFLLAETRILKISGSEAFYIWPPQVLPQPGVYALHSFLLCNGAPHLFK